MNDPQVSERNGADGKQAQLMSARFAQMVSQQSNLAMMLLGLTEHPQSGEMVKDIEGAQMFIGQLEMLEVKTSGNLSKEESALLKQSLMALRLAFVEAVNSNPPPSEAPAAGPGPAASSVPATEPAAASSAPHAPAGEEENRKKFTKKY